MTRGTVALVMYAVLVGDALAAVPVPPASALPELTPSSVPASAFSLSATDWAERLQNLERGRVTQLQFDAFRRSLDERIGSLRRFGDHYSKSVNWQWGAIVCGLAGGVGYSAAKSPTVGVIGGITAMVCGVASLIESSIAASVIGEEMKGLEQATWLALVNDEPLEFEVPKTEAPALWGRAVAYLTQRCAMKIQTATDFALQTFSPGDVILGVGYSVAKTLLKDSVRISVRCVAGHTLNESLAIQNAHILAHYIRTGDLPYPELIWRPVEPAGNLPPFN